MDNPLGAIHFKYTSWQLLNFFKTSIPHPNCDSINVLIQWYRWQLHSQHGCIIRMCRSTALVVNSMVDGRISRGFINHKTATTLRTPPVQRAVRFTTIFDQTALASPRCHHLLGNQTIDRDLGRFAKSILLCRDLLLYV